MANHAFRIFQGSPAIMGRPFEVVGDRGEVLGHDEAEPLRPSRLAGLDGFALYHHLPVRSCASQGKKVGECFLAPRAVH